MSSIFKLIVSMSISGSVLILILMMLKPLFREGFSKAWQYYIWVVVLVRLLVPFSPEFGLVNDLFHAPLTHEIPIIQTLTDKPSKQSVATSNQAPTQSTVSNESPLISNVSDHVSIHLPDAWTVIAFLWITGMMLLMIVRISQYLLFTYYLKREADPVADSRILSAYRRTVNELGIKRKPRIFSNGSITSPMLIGLFRPTIYLTEAALRMEEKSLSYVFRHELMHYKRHDLLYKWCCCITQCIHWFNPIVYIMNRQINSLCEISCDEAVAKDLSTQERLIYGNVLLTAASANISYNQHVLSTTLYEDKKSLKERIKSIVNAGHKSKKIVTLSIIAAIALCVAAFWLGAYTMKDKSSNNNDTATTAAIDKDTSTVNYATKNSVFSTNTSKAANNNIKDSSVDNSNDNTKDSSNVSKSGTTVTVVKNSSYTAGKTSVASSNGASESTTKNVTSDSDSIQYSNTKYGFDFTLPASWKGYTIQTEDWQGIALEGKDQGNVVETGTKILIRHPEWTTDNPRQDIPIMVFTLDQWDKVEKEEIAVSAAPIGPSKLGSNSKYVFALPARYNYAFPTGYEEVEKIIESNPIVPNENFN